MSDFIGTQGTSDRILQRESKALNQAVLLGPGPSKTATLWAARVVQIGAIAFLSWGCTGELGGTSVSESSGAGSNGSSSGELGGEGEGLSNDAKSLLARVWRLSHDQYQKSVLELTGVVPDLSNFVPETGNGKFANFSSTAFVRVDLAAGYYDVAKSVADEISTESLLGLTSCDLQVSCRDAFISEIGARAFRSPVPTELSERLSAIFDLATAEGDAESGYRAVLAAVLNSPLFLYRKEIGPSDEASNPEFSLTSHQIAEFLSYSLLDVPPPDWLIEQARAGDLEGEAFSSAVNRLVAEPDFEAQLTNFLSEWLEVTHFERAEKSDVFPGFDAAKPLMMQELFDFFSQSGRAEHGFAQLLLDPVPTVSDALQEFYYSDPSAPESGERLGVLGLGAVLAGHAKSYLTSPTLRGTFVRARFFCQEITLPENFTPPPLSETEVLGTARTTRELYEQHQTDPSCAVCHRLTDNIGFAMESFDGAGRFRTQDTTQGDVVELMTASELTDSDVDRTLDGLRDLSTALSESQLVKDCFALQAFRFFFGQVEASESLLAITAGREQLATSETLGDLTRGLLTTPTTSVRTREKID